MTEIKKDKLEDALNNENPEQPKVSREMEIGFHRGALNTLINERNELVKIVVQVERVMQAHVKRLEELGVKIKTSEKKE